MKDCKCQTVKQYDKGVWQCMVCRRKFIPIDICGKCDQVQAEEQRDVNLLAPVKEAVA